MTLNGFDVKYSSKIKSFMPKAVLRQNTTLLELIEGTVKNNGQVFNSNQMPDSYLSNRNQRNFCEMIGARISGKRAARYVIDKNPDLFKYDPSRGYFNCYSKSKCLNKSPGTYNIYDLKSALDYSNVTKSLEIYYDIVKNSKYQTLDKSIIQSLLDHLALQETLKYLNIQLDYLESVLIRNSMDFSLFVNKPSNLKDDDIVAKLFHSIPDLEASHYDTMISYLCLTSKLNSTCHVYDDALKKGLQLNFMSKASYIVAKCIIENPHFNYAKKLNYCIQEASRQRMEICTKSINRLLHTFKYESKGFFVGLDLVKGFIEQLKLYHIYPDIITLSALFYRLYPSESYQINSLDFFVNELQILPKDELKICIEFPPIICLLMYRLLDHKKYNHIRTLYKFSISNPSFISSLPVIESQIIFEKYAISLILSENPRDALMEMRSFVPSSYILKPNLTIQLLKRVSETKQYDCINWIYRVLIEHRKTFCDLKQKLLMVCLESVQDMTSRMDKDIRYTIENIVVNFIDETLSIYKDRKQILSYDFDENIETLSSLVFICIYLEMGEELVKLKEKIFENQNKLGILLSKQKSIIEEYSKKNSIFSWLLSILP